LPAFLLTNMTSPLSSIAMQFFQISKSVTVAQCMLSVI